VAAAGEFLVQIQDELGAEVASREFEQTVAHLAEQLAQMTDK